MRTPGEEARFRETIARLKGIREFICRTRPANDDVTTWFAYLSALRSLQGNANNDLSFLACLLAKEYLVQHHGDLAFDAAAKCQADWMLVDADVNLFLKDLSGVQVEDRE